MTNIDFSGLIRMYHAQALIYLGAAENPITGRFEKNLEQAQLLINILKVLNEKSYGNLTEEEEALINESLGRLGELLENEL